MPIQASLAQDAPSKPAPKAPDETNEAFDRNMHFAKLDMLKAEANYGEIGRLIELADKPEEAVAHLDWLGMQFQTGASSYFSFQYSQLLISFASTLPDSQGKQIRGTALAAIMHAIIASQAEAQQCADRTARSDRPMRFLQTLRSSGLMELDDFTRSQSGWIALKMEQRTWAIRRQIDDTSFLCANGMRAFAAGLANGKSKEVETPEGQLGRTLAVKPPEEMSFERVANETWWPKAEEIRARNEATLKTLLNVDVLAPTAGN